MPATSKVQFRLMKSIAEGSIPPKGKLTKEKAAEFISGQTSAELPERKRVVVKRVKKKKKKRRRFRVG